MIAYLKEKLALLKGWRTVLFGAAVSALGAWDSLAAAGFDVSPFLSETSRPRALALIGLVVVGLRYVTTSEMGKK